MSAFEKSQPHRATEIVFSESQYTQLYAHLFQENGDEQAAFAFVSPAVKENKVRLLVHHIIELQPEHFASQSGAFLHVEKSTAIAIAQHALDNQWGLVDIHSHPFANDYVGFSSIDTSYALPRFRWFAEKAQRAFPHAMLVFGKNSVDGLIYDPDTDSMRKIESVTILSSPIRRFWIAQPESALTDSAYLNRTARQVQAFGEHGQAKIAALTVGIVGLGGVGSSVAHQLALLGVRKFVLVDADTVETTNLNRLIGASFQDAIDKTPKVHVLERAIKQIDPSAKIHSHRDMFPTADTVDALKQVDVLFGCTDTHGSRLLLNEFSLQYMLPYIDIGVGIDSDAAGQILEAGGQFRVLLPGRFCLQCIRAVDADQAARDLLPAEMRSVHRARGYIPAEDIPAPSVGFLNGTLACLAVGEFLNLVTGFQEPSDIVYYFLKGQTMKRVRATRDAECVACGKNGRLAAGDLEPVLGLSAIPVRLETVPLPSASSDLNAAQDSSAADQA